MKHFLLQTLTLVFRNNKVLFKKEYNLKLRFRIDTKLNIHRITTQISQKSDTKYLISQKYFFHILYTCYETHL